MCADKHVKVRVCLHLCECAWLCTGDCSVVESERACVCKHECECAPISVFMYRCEHVHPRESVCVNMCTRMGVTAGTSACMSVHVSVSRGV